MKTTKLKNGEVIDVAAQMLVSAQFDCIKNTLRPTPAGAWVRGYYIGRRSSVKFVLRYACYSGGSKEVAAAIRKWVGYFKKQNQVLPVAV